MNNSREDILIMNEEKKMMSIVAADGSIDEVEVVLAFEFKDNQKEYDDVLNRIEVSV